MFCLDDDNDEVFNDTNNGEEVNPSFMGGLSGGNKLAGDNRKNKKNSNFSGGLISPFNRSKENLTKPFGGLSNGK